MTKWVLFDLETAGLADDAEILELAAHHVGKRLLDLKGDGLDLQLVHSEEPEIEPGARSMHEASGLLKELDSARAAILQGHVPLGCVVNYEQLDYALHEYLRNISDKERSIYLVGNTVSFDWGFVKRRLPKSFTLLSHRVIDVSVFRSQWNVWCSELVRGPVAHRARGDILMSLGGLRWQQQVITAGAAAVGERPDDDFARAASIAKPSDSSL